MLDSISMVHQSSSNISDLLLFLFIAYERGKVIVYWRFVHSRPRSSFQILISFLPSLTFSSVFLFSFLCARGE
jgi:hypothetical protein